MKQEIEFFDWLIATKKMLLTKHRHPINIEALLAIVAAYEEYKHEAMARQIQAPESAQRS